MCYLEGAPWKRMELARRSWVNKVLLDVSVGDDGCVWRSAEGAFM